MDLAGLTQSEYGIDTLLHLTCTNIVQERLDDALKVLSQEGFSDFNCGEFFIDLHSASAGSKIPRDSKYLGFERRYDSGTVCKLLTTDTVLLPIDPPRGQESWISVDSRFQHAIDLVKYIRQSEEFSSNFCIGVAGVHV